MTHLFPIELYGIERLKQIHIPEEQRQYVLFSPSAAEYESIGNPWSFAIDLDGDCIGYLTAEEDTEGDLYIHKLVIDEAHQKKGAGTQAMNEFIQMARNAGAHFVFLSVAYQNHSATRFYESLGFSETELGIAEAGCKLLALSLT